MQRSFTPAASRIVGRAVEAARLRGSGVVDLPDLHDAVAAADDRFRELLAYADLGGVLREFSAGADDSLRFSAAVKGRLAAAYDIARLSRRDAIDVRDLALAVSGANVVASCIGFPANSE